MAHRRPAQRMAFALAASVLVALPVAAQLAQPRPGAAPLRAAPVTPAPAPAGDREVLLDRVVAVVNNEASTQHEVN